MRQWLAMSDQDASEQQQGLGGPKSYGTPLGRDWSVPLGPGFAATWAQLMGAIDNPGVAFSIELELGFWHVEMIFWLNLKHVVFG